MPRTERSPIDWMPGEAARQALDAAQRLRPELRQREPIDALMILGLWAMQVRPPVLRGRDRDRWTLPDLARGP